MLASSVQVENIPPSVYPDGISPETAISFGGVAVPAEDGTYISGAATVVLSGSDPQVPDVVTSGFNLTNHILSPDSATVEISTYTGPFALPEGAHPMFYLSVDNAGNYEFPRGTTIYVDATPPATQLSGSDMELLLGSSLYAAISGTVTLSAADPLVAGARSGLNRTFYLVDQEFAACPGLAQFLAGGQSSTGTPGTCEKPIYAGPFFLSPRRTRCKLPVFRQRPERGNPPKPSILTLPVVICCC